MTDRPLVQSALEDLGGGRIEGDVAELIATWPLCQLFRLQPGDHAVVAGAYKGKVMAALLDLYPGITVTGFEPQRWAFDAAAERLDRWAGIDNLTDEEIAKRGPTAWQRVWRNNQERAEVDRARARLYPFGLGAETRENVPMGEFGTDACSFVNVGPQAREHGSGNIVEAQNALAAVGEIDLMILNMEGYEFQLIEYLGQIKLLPWIKRLAVQWHMGLDPTRDPRHDWNRMNDLIALLYQHGHRLIYDERPSWTYSEVH